MIKKLFIGSVVFVSILLALTFVSGVNADEVIVIANSGVSQNDISAKDLGNMFLGKKKSWDGGMKAVPVTLESGPTHENFLKTYVKKSASQFSTFWKQAIFTGQGIPPKSVGSETDAVKFVNENPGAVGYILASTPHDGVKVLNIK